MLSDEVLRVLPDMPPLRIRQGGAIAERSLVHRVNAAYPLEAKFRRLSGIVRLHMVIDTHGAVSVVEPLSGHPLLVPPAVDAVKQWRYRPTTLNGEPVEVDTTIDVIFSLQ